MKAWCCPGVATLTAALATALLVAAIALVSTQTPALAADAGTPGSHSSPGGTAPAAKPGLHSFRCGTGYCDARKQYCETIKTDVPELPSDHACVPLPPACRAGAQKEAPNCGCFPEGSRCNFCSTVGPRGGSAAFHRTCVGGA